MPGAYQKYYWRVGFATKLYDWLCPEAYWQSIRTCVELAPKKQGAVWLDIGCGSGQLIRTRPLLLRPHVTGRQNAIRSSRLPEQKPGGCRDQAPGLFEKQLCPALGHIGVGQPRRSGDQTLESLGVAFLGQGGLGGG